MAEVNVQITQYQVTALPLDHVDAYVWSCTVEQRATDKWAVCVHGRVLNSEGDWEWEPTPSSRTDEFLARTRFDHDTALRLAREAAPGITINGMTAADILARGPRRG